MNKTVLRELKKIVKESSGAGKVLENIDVVKWVKARNLPLEREFMFKDLQQLKQLAKKRIPNGVKNDSGKLLTTCVKNCTGTLTLSLYYSIIQLTL